MTAKYSQFNNPATPVDTSDVPLMNVAGYGFENQSMNQQSTVVQVQQGVQQQQQPVYEMEEKHSWRHFVMSIVTFIIGGIFCLNPLTSVFSVLGMVYSSNAYLSHGDKAWERYRRESKMAKIFWITSLVFVILSVIACAVVVAAVVMLFKNQEKQYTNMANHYSHSYDSNY